MTTRFFFPQGALDQWTVDEHVDARDGSLTLVKEGRKFAVSEAVHVVAEVSGSPDAHGLLGRVRPRDALAEQGAEVMENSMIFGDNAYDVVPGFLAEPVGDFGEFLASSAWQEAQSADAAVAAIRPSSDEDLLQGFLRRTAS